MAVKPRRKKKLCRRCLITRIVLVTFVLLAFFAWNNLSGFFG